MKWYCLVSELKPEHVQDYVDIHFNAHKTEWKSLKSSWRQKLHIASFRQLPHIVL